MCPENCDASCYRCLRSFKNKFEHSFLDRHVASELLEYLTSGTLPEFNLARLQKSTSWLSNDLRRQAEPGLTYQDSVQVAVGKGASVTAPILATRKDGKHFAIALSGPLTTGHPANLLQLPKTAGAPELIIVNELLVRAHLPAATREVKSRTAL